MDKERLEIVDESRHDSGEGKYGKHYYLTINFISRCMSSTYPYITVVSCHVI